MFRKALILCALETLSGAVVGQHSGEWRTPANLGAWAWRERISTRNKMAVVDLILRDEGKPSVYFKGSEFMLSNYEAISPQTVDIRVPAGHSITLKLYFPLTAAKPGLLSFQYQTQNAAGFVSQGSPPIPTFRKTGSPREYSFTNPDRARSIELKLDEVLVKGKHLQTKAGLIRIAPRATVSVTRFMPQDLTYFTLKYSWRLSPNKRWLHNMVS
jgi:hypothetical protein